MFETWVLTVSSPIDSSLAISLFDRPRARAVRTPISRGDMPSGRAERPSEPDLGAPLEDRDEHDVGNADTTDQQRDRPKSQDQ